MTGGDAWQRELSNISRNRGRGEFAVFRPARDDELDWAEKKLSKERHLLSRPRQDIAAAITCKQFYILEDLNGRIVGCGAVWPVRPGAVKSEPGVPGIELGAVWLDELLRGYGLERILGQIGIAEAVAANPRVEIYSGAVFTNPKSERNVRWLGFINTAGAQRIWWPHLCKKCSFQKAAR
ncbi:MAG TPA: hypothetical protein VE993_21725, partial [Stellaceae bacterium]|nr:hypothetical protein [Stellaceae bacterium]